MGHEVLKQAAELARVPSDGRQLAGLERRPRFLEPWAQVVRDDVGEPARLRLRPALARHVGGHADEAVAELGHPPPERSADVAVAEIAGLP